MNITVTVDEEFADALAAKILRRLETGAPATLARAGLNVQQPPQPADDPWGGAASNPSWDPPASPQTSSQSSPGPIQGPPAAAPGSQGNVISMTTPTGVQTWTLNLPAAPQCQHGKPAGYVQGITKNGKPYKAWRCAFKSSQSEWRQACDFNDWA